MVFIGPAPSSVVMTEVVEASRVRTPFLAFESEMLSAHSPCSKPARRMRNADPVPAKATRPARKVRALLRLLFAHGLPWIKQP
jgi:hypothetical protein